MTSRFLAVGGGSSFSSDKEVFASAGHIAGAAIELPQSGVEQVIAAQGGVLARFIKGADAGQRPLNFGDDNGAVEQINWRSLDRQQGVVQSKDRDPIGFRLALCRAVIERDPRFEMERRKSGSLGRSSEELLVRSINRWFHWPRPCSSMSKIWPR